jgi:hypothetical protein
MTKEQHRQTLAAIFAAQLMTELIRRQSSCFGFLFMSEKNFKEANDLIPSIAFDLADGILEYKS